MLKSIAHLVAALFAILVATSCARGSASSVCAIADHHERSKLEIHVVRAELIADHMHGSVMYDAACPEVAYDVERWSEDASPEFYRETMEGLRGGKFKVEAVVRVVSPARHAARGTIEIIEVTDFERLPTY